MTDQKQINEQYAVINSAKNILHDSDYISHKILDAIIRILTEPSPTFAKLGAAVRGILDDYQKDYPDYVGMRQNMRTDINNAQDVITELEAQEESDLHSTGEEVSHDE